MRACLCQCVVRVCLFVSVCEWPNIEACSSPENKTKARGSVCACVRVCACVVRVSVCECVSAARLKTTPARGSVRVGACVCDSCVCTNSHTRTHIPRTKTHTQTRIHVRKHAYTRMVLSHGFISWFYLTNRTMVLTHGFISPVKKSRMQRFLSEQEVATYWPEGSSWILIIVPSSVTEPL